MSIKGVDRFQAGAVEVLCLSDGDIVFGAEVFPTLDAATRSQRLTAAGQVGIASEFNAYALRHAGGVDLVDTGCGATFGPGAGRLPALLTRLGIAPSDISRVIYTHLHRDHVGGALADGALVFPDAEVVLHSAEAAHWRGTGGLGDQMMGISDRLSLLEDGADLGQGMSLWHLPGHTPGHCGLRLDGLVLIGDVLHSEALQLPDPALPLIYDVDAELAAQTRRNTLSYIAFEGLSWSGSHMLGPEKFAKLDVDGKGFTRVAL